MLPLAISILSSASIPLLLKLSESKKLNRYTVTTANYFVAFSVSLLFAIQDGGFNNLGCFASFFRELVPVVIQNQGKFNYCQSFYWALIIGILGGVFYFLGFIAIQKSIKENGVNITSAFSKIGIMIPMSFSIYLWGEIPTTLQWIGIFFAMGAILAAHYEKKFKESLRNIKKSLLLTFLFVGFAEFSNKFFQYYALGNFRSWFLFLVFFTAFTISLLITLKNRKPVTKQAIFLGALVGVPNMLTSYFIIQALESLKATIVFPIYSSATILMISFGGLVLFGENLQKREVVSILLTITAVIFINL